MKKWHMQIITHEVVEIIKSWVTDTSDSDSIIFREFSCITAVNLFRMKKSILQYNFYFDSLKHIAINESINTDKKQSLQTFQSIKHTISKLPIETHSLPWKKTTFLLLETINRTSDTFQHVNSSTGIIESELFYSVFG